MKQTKPIIWGILATLGIIIFYISVLTIFAGSSFALSQFKGLWVWLVPLAIGFGTQVGLFISIRNDVCLKKNVATSGAISGSSMVICCSHFLLNFIPILGLSALASFLMSYQKLFFGIGIASSIFGIIMVLNHKRKMKGRLYQMKEKKDTIQINGKTIAIAVILLLLLVGTFLIFAFSGKENNSAGTSNNADKIGTFNENMPKECEVPAGQDINTWKEHLGHHENTKYCLDYYK